MSCPYYWWNYHYACRKSEKDVNEDTYSKYCSGYDYDDCPIYKQSDSSSGCFLTSACVEAKGLPDNCRELTLLRSFRDGYMRSIPTGQADICEYYHIAPIIVDKIKKQPNMLDIFEEIYTDLIIPCVNLIESGNNQQAYDNYRNYVKKLQVFYL